MGIKNMFIVFILYFKFTFSEQPSKWPPLNEKRYQYFATKSILGNKTTDVSKQETQLIQFYQMEIDGWIKKVMSSRVHGIYTTAIWDFQNMKAHFLYDKYRCTTQ